LIFKKIARPDMAPQNIYPWSLTFDHVLIDDSQLAINQLHLMIMTVLLGYASTPLALSSSATTRIGRGTQAMTVG
jgi:hypothetical protein